MDTATLIARESFVERGARERVAGLLDAGTMRELLDPFERLRSPWLAEQDIVTQADDGVVIARGAIAGTAVVCCAVEPAFQGGAIGEVGGAKIAGALELALEDAEAGRPVVPVLLLETGGVRLQEANCGLAAIAEIHAAIAALRAHVPVVGVVAGPVGCFGGMPPHTPCEAVVEVACLEHSAQGATATMASALRWVKLPPGRATSSSLPMTTHAVKMLRISAGRSLRERHRHAK